MVLDLFLLDTFPRSCAKQFDVRLNILMWASKMYKYIEICRVTTKLSKQTGLFNSSLHKQYEDSAGQVMTAIKAQCLWCV